MIRAQDFVYDGQDCKILTFRDITNVRNYAKAQEERNLMHLIVSGVSHEMLTPLKCIIELSKVNKHEVKRNKPDLEKVAQNMRIIDDTANLLMFQTKSNLDSNLAKQQKLNPYYSLKQIDEVVVPVLNMLHQ